MKKLYAILLVSGLVFIANPRFVSASANGLPYSTYTYSTSTNQLVRTQDAYLPLSIQDNIAGLELKEPQDITVDANDIIYVADTGNSRIIKYNLADDTVATFGEGILDQPTGVHVDIEGSVYVADFGTKAAYKFVYNDGTGVYDLATTYAKPVGTPYFSDEDAFDPTKVITDRGLNVYILLAGNINGLAEYENDGTFFGYFGGNRIADTWDNTIKSLLFDEQQRREWFQMIPKPVYNIAVDPQGLILTTTKTESGYLKLNIANYVYNQAEWGFDNVEDIFVGPYNTVFTITSDGYIVEYDPNGSTLFIFSGPDSQNQKGLFTTPTGLAVDSKNNIYVVDKTTNALQVFVPTDFAVLVHQAIDLYFQGRYAESLGPWTEVLKMNRLFDCVTASVIPMLFVKSVTPPCFKVVH
ncbi:MAG: NHL repeat-containing protein [Firmicutes bacterium]|nr:NHL repeat-containing protein [Bacillota bacterium]